METFIIVSDTAQITGGNARVAVDTAIGLKNAGKNVIFFAGGGQTCNDLINANIKVINLNMPDILSGNKFKIFFSGIYNRKAKKAFLNLLNTINCDKLIIHVHSWVRILSASIFDVLRKKKIHFYITAHDYFLSCPNGGYYNYPKNIICPQKNRKGINCLKSNCDSRNYIFKIWRYIKTRKQTKILKKCDFSVIYISKLMYENLAINAEKIYVQNPINLAENARLIETKPKKFAFVGRVSYEKGVTLFCEALKQTGYEGIIFGNGVLLDQLKKDYNLPNIHFAGWVNQTEIKEKHNEIISLVFPSMWYEGAPLTIPEFQSVGIPVIVSDACSGTDYIDSNKNGYIFKSNDIDSLIEKMQIIYNMKEEDYFTLCNNTRKIAINNNHNKEQYINDLLKVLK